MRSSLPATSIAATRYVLQCARNGNSPLTPDELRALIAALAEASQGDGLPGGG